MLKLWQKEFTIDLIFVLPFVMWTRPTYERKNLTKKRIIRISGLEGKRVISHRYGLTKQSPIGLGRAMRLMNPCYMQCATHGYSLEGPNTYWIETYHPNTHKWGLTSYKISIKSNTLGSEFSFQRSNFCGLWLANCLVSEEKIVTSLLKVSKT